MNFIVAINTQRYDIKPMFFAVPLVMVVLMCLIATMFTNQLGRFRPGLVVFNTVIDPLPSLLAVWVSGLIIGLGFLNNLLAVFCISIRHNLFFAFFSKFIVIMVSHSLNTALALFALAVQSIFAIFVFAEILNGLWFTLKNTILVGANLGFHSYILKIKTPLRRCCSLLSRKESTPKGVRFNNNIWLFVEQLFSLRDRDIIAQVGETC